MAFFRNVLILVALLGLVACKHDAAQEEVEPVAILEPQQEIQVVGDIEVVVDKTEDELVQEDEPEAQDADNTEQEETKTSTPEEEAKDDMDGTIETITDDDIRDLDAEMDAFIEEILSGIE